MTQATWNSGTPSTRGWYNADFVSSKSSTIYRWWNGKNWSVGVESSEPKTSDNVKAPKPMGEAFTADIVWR